MAKRVDCYSKRVYDVVSDLVREIEVFLQGELWDHHAFTDEESWKIQELLSEAQSILSKVQSRLITRYKAHEIPPEACKGWPSND